jgi:hypothetical protein
MLHDSLEYCPTLFAKINNAKAQNGLAILRFGVSF